MIRLGSRTCALARVLAPLLVVVGVVAVLVGVVNVVGATRATAGYVAVPVRIVGNDGTAVGVVLAFDDGPANDLGVSGPPTGGLPNLDPRSYPQGVLTLRAPGGTVAEQLLSRADVLLRGGAPLVPWLATASVLGRLPRTSGMLASPPHHVEAWVVAALVLVVAGLVRGVAEAALARPGGTRAAD